MRQGQGALSNLAIRAPDAWVLLPCFGSRTPDFRCWEWPERGTSGGYSQSAANPCSAGLPPGSMLVLFMFLPPVEPPAAFGAPGVRAGAVGPWPVPLLASRQ